MVAQHPGNISREATTHSGNIFNEAMRQGRPKTSQALPMRSRIVPKKLEVHLVIDQILESIKRFCMRTSNSGH
jgi:hypothetical protein